MLDFTSDSLVNQEHLNCFVSSLGEPVRWIGSRPVRQWANLIGATEGLNRLPDWDDDKPKRSDLLQLCADPGVPPEACFVAIMAWGGMKKSHGERAWRERADWIGIVEALRNGKLDRKSAYAAFQKFRSAHPGCGLGPAYFTKLIFFAGNAHDGYIMDQWTSLSINLLCAGPANPLVSLQTSVWRGYRSDTVTDDNTSDTYDRFCRAIECVARLVGRTPAETEECLFSQGGRSPLTWRAYVKANRP